MTTPNANTPPPAKTIDVEVEPVEKSALAIITAAEIDTQISTAHKFPRSMAVYKRRAIEMATIDPETAESCLYSRPVGKGDDGKQKYAEGMSVRLAEIVAACYGNIRVQGMVIEMTPRYVKARGMAHDLESNSAASTEVIEATVKRPRQGQKEGDPYDERMRAVIAKACVAKARRDAIFQVVPRALARPVEAAVRALLAGDTKSIERRRKTALAWIKDVLKIDPARVWQALDVKGVDDLDTELLDRLTGLRTAINDNDTTKDEAFPPIIASGTVGKTAPASGEADPKAEGRTPVEEAADAAATAKAGESTAPADKGPTADQLRKNILKKIGAANIGKAVLMGKLVEQKTVEEGVTFDKLTREQLAAIDDDLENLIAVINTK